jgi:hypothetical protein
MSALPHQAEVTLPRALALVRLADLAAKAVLVLMIVLVLVDPGWGNLEGKAPQARAIIYPLFAFLLPAIWWGRWRRRTPFPWVADLLVTVPCFSDVLGNRLDLFDRVVWFDDWMHLLNSVLIAAAVILLTVDRHARFLAVVERGVAVSVTASLAWELFEYLSFMTRSSERPMAYTDTLGDLLLSWLGALVAAVLVHGIRTFPTLWPRADRHLRWGRSAADTGSGREVEWSRRDPATRGR